MPVKRCPKCGRGCSLRLTVCECGEVIQPKAPIAKSYKRMNAVKLYQKHSMESLVELRKHLEANPANRLPPGGLFIYTPSARKKMSDIDLAITFHLADRRAAAGNPVKTNGYSGRQTNRT